MLNLTDHERTILTQFTAHDDPSYARRARVILLSAEGAATNAVIQAVGLSATQVRYWRREWEKRRLDIFPDKAVIAPPATEPQTGEQIEAVADAEPAPRPGIDVPRLPLILAEKVGIQPDDPMAEAGRKALFFHFERMLQHEPGSRLGEDIEAVHDMRVATRRMRSALRLFGSFFQAEAIQPYRDNLRRIAGALGAVRDLEVWIDKAQQFASRTGSDLTPLLDVWQKQLHKARRALIKELDGKPYRRFVGEFHDFLTTPGKGARRLPAPDSPEAYQVRHIAPRLVYQFYERVRAYETIIANADAPTLHALRIDFKRLRYALEFFEDVLGPEAERVIKQVKNIQDHLGDLNDAEIARAALREFVDQHNSDFSGVPLAWRPDLSGVLAYAAAIDETKHHLLDTFPQVWAAFTAESARRDLALAVAVL